MTTTTIPELLRESDPIRCEPAWPAADRLRVRQRVLAAPLVHSRPTRRIVLAAGTLGVLLVALFGWRVWPGGVVEAAVRFEVRLAEHAPAAGLTAAVATDSGRTVYLHSDVVVSNGDIASARLEPGDGDGQFGVDIALTATGAEQIRAASAGHVGRPMAVLIDGQVVAAPVVRSPIGEAAIITGAYSREQAERIVSGIVGE